MDEDGTDGLGHLRRVSDDLIAAPEVVHQLPVDFLGDLVARFVPFGKQASFMIRKCIIVRKGEQQPTRLVSCRRTKSSEGRFGVDGVVASELTFQLHSIANAFPLGPSGPVVVKFHIRSQPLVEGRHFVLEIEQFSSLCIFVSGVVSGFLAVKVLGENVADGFSDDRVDASKFRGLRLRVALFGHPQDAPIFDRLFLTNVVIAESLEQRRRKVAYQGRGVCFRTRIDFARVTDVIRKIRLGGFVEVLELLVVEVLGAAHHEAGSVPRKRNR
mmetsp:Transcript_13167/g.29009  ORF Transcript_13167/g.29009 Transcript_13167/m.29009 type:complete len:271 (+) Transcript_13167:1018-1830(+)